LDKITLNNKFEHSIDFEQSASAEFSGTLLELSGVDDNSIFWNGNTALKLNL